MEPEPHEGDKGSTTSSGSTKLAQGIKKVLEKYIGSDSRLNFNFEPKRPERFFKEITVVKERINQQGMRHRIFPEVKENVKPQTEGEIIQTLNKPSHDSKFKKSVRSLNTQVIKPVITEAIRLSPQLSPNASLSINECGSSQSSFSSSKR